MLTATLLLLLHSTLGFIHNKAKVYENNEECTVGNKTYVINFHAHVQNEVAEILASLVSKADLGTPMDPIRTSSGESSKLEAVKSYLGTLIEEINMDLYPYGVQLRLIIPEYSVDEHSTNGSYDPSCELESPAKLRTQNAFAKLHSHQDSSVGVHFYIFGCMYNNPNFDATYILNHSNCGRVLGILWNGSAETKQQLKSLIMESISGSPDAYRTGKLVLSKKNNSLCSYSNTCIGLTESKLGVILNHKERILYTKQEEDYHGDSIDADY